MQRTGRKANNNNNYLIRVDGGEEGRGSGGGGGLTRVRNICNGLFYSSDLSAAAELMAAEISHGNETIGMERDEEWGGGGMSGEDGRVGEKEGPQRGPEGGRSSVSPPALSSSRGSRQSRSRDARARSYMYRVDEPARIIIFPRNMELQAMYRNLALCAFTKLGKKEI